MLLLYPFPLQETNGGIPFRRNSVESGVIRRHRSPRGEIVESERWQVDSLGHNDTASRNFSERRTTTTTTTRTTRSHPYYKASPYGNKGGGPGCGWR